MANLATTATESLQCIACAIRQKKRRMIEVEDITEYLTNAKEEGLNGSSNSAVDVRIRIPTNSVIPFLLRWYESGTEMSEMLESEYSPSKFKTRKEQEDYDDMMDTLELREKKGTDYAAWANSSVWIANRLAATGYIKSSKDYTFLHADQPIKDGGTDIKSTGKILLKRCAKSAEPSTFKTAADLMARGTGDKWNPADIFAIEDSKRAIIGSDLEKFISKTQPNPPMGPEIKTMRESNDELKEMTKGAKGVAAKNINLLEEMGELYEFNQYVDSLASKFQCLPISLKKAQNGFPPVVMMRHKMDRGARKAISLEVKITGVDYKPTAEKAIVYFSVGGKSGANLDFRAFESSADIMNVQAQIQAAGSSASHGKIALPLYSFIVEESGGITAIEEHKRKKMELFGREFTADDHVFTPAKIFDEYANTRAHKSGTIPRQRFNRRTLIEDVEKWGEYIHWLTGSTVSKSLVIREVRHKLGDPTDLEDDALWQEKDKQKNGRPAATEENYKNNTGPWDPKAGSINMRLNPRAKARPWPKNPDGTFKKLMPKNIYYATQKDIDKAMSGDEKMAKKVRKPQDFIWAAKFIKNKVQSAEAIWVVDLAKSLPTEAIKENILKAAYSYAASKGLRIFNDSGVREFMSASTYVKVGG